MSPTNSSSCLTSPKANYGATTNYHLLGFCYLPNFVEFIHSQDICYINRIHVNLANVGKYRHTHNTRMHTHMHTHTHTRARTHTHTHTRAHTHTHTHTQSQLQQPFRKASDWLQNGLHLVRYCVQLEARN